MIENMEICNFYFNSFAIIELFMSIITISIIISKSLRNLYDATEIIKSVNCVNVKNITVFLSKY